MREALFEAYEPGASRVHRLPAGAKLGALLAYLLALLAVPRGAWWAFAVAAAVLLIAAGLARVSARRVMLRWLALEPFALGVAVLTLLQPGGLAAFLHLAARSSLGLGALVLFAATTRFTGVLGVLRGLRVPALLVTTLALLYRYLFLLASEAHRLERARASRTFVPGRTARWRALGAAAAQLFVRSARRASRIHATMVARGWRS
jgi:cobalt/nickel transport system permease protein